MIYAGERVKQTTTSSRMHYVVGSYSKVKAKYLRTSHIKFGAFVRNVPIPQKFAAKLPDY